MRSKEVPWALRRRIHQEYRSFRGISEGLGFGLGLGLADERHMPENPNSKSSDLPYYRAFHIDTNTSRRISSSVEQRSGRRYGGGGGGDEDLGLPMADDDKRKPRRLPWDQINWSSCTRSRNPAGLFLLTLMLVTLVTIIHILGDNHQTCEEGVRILFETNHFVHQHQRVRDNGKSFSAFNHRLPSLPKERQKHRDFGNLEILVPSNIEFSDYDMIIFERERQEFLEVIDNGSQDEEFQPDSDSENENEACPKVSWAAYNFPTCNQIHEAPQIERYQDDGYDVSYLNSGSYRDAFRFQRQRQTPPDHFVMKRMRASSSVGAREVFNVHKEAIILERLSASPLILDVYSYCGTSVVVEPMASDLYTKVLANNGNGVDSQERLDTLRDIYPQNNLTASEKLHISLEMAKSLASLHGFEGGPITHADVLTEQWLIAPDGSIKLNDFNNAWEPAWSKNKMRYCTSRTTYGGTNRSPEEYSGEKQDESKDTFAFGNNIYTMITGLIPFYDDKFRKVSNDKIQEGIISGRRPFVDDRYRSRSFIELKLIDIMERCWAQERIDRPSIFEVVLLLQATKDEAAKRGELYTSSWIDIPIPSAVE